MSLIRVLMFLLRFVLGLAVLGCIAASCFFAFEFGITRSDNSWISLGYGAVALSLDLLKSGLPLFSSESSDRAHKATCWIAFAFLTCMSLWCAYGMTATQLAERLATKSVAQTELSEKQGTLARLVAQQERMAAPIRTTPEAVTSQQKAADDIAEQIKTESARGSCKDICRQREADQRTANALLVKMQSDLAATVAYDKLAADVKDAQAAVDKVDKTKAVKQADPQTENMAKVLGVSTDSLALVSHAVLAIAIEIGSGLGFWLVFGHAGIRYRQPDKPREPAVAKHGELEFDDDSRLRFFRDCVKAATGERVSASIMHSAYAGWCAGQLIAPMSPQAFGKETPWPKDKIGGSVWYLNCRLGSASRPALQLVAG